MVSIMDARDAILPLSCDKLKIEIDLVIEDDAWGAEAKLLALAQKATYEVMVHLGFSDVESELSLVFTNDKAIQAINAQWRNINKATNVLSFPAFDIAPDEEPDVMLGDIIIAYETVMREAGEEGKIFDHHLTHLFVHGLLHLLGYDHENEEDAEIMETLEREILQKLNIKDPYAQ